MKKFAAVLAAAILLAITCAPSHAAFPCRGTDSNPCWSK